MCQLHIKCPRWRFIWSVHYVAETGMTMLRDALAAEWKQLNRVTIPTDDTEQWNSTSLDCTNWCCSPKKVNLQRCLCYLTSCLVYLYVYCKEHCVLWFWNFVFIDNVLYRVWVKYVPQWKLQFLGKYLMFLCKIFDSYSEGLFAFTLTVFVKSCWSA